MWPRGDLPPEPPTLTADDTSATWTAKLLDRLDAMDAWADYVVAYCVRHAPVETPLRSFRPPEPDECDDRGGRAGDGSCMNNPVSTGPTVYSARTWYGGWLPVVIP